MAKPTSKQEFQNGTEVTFAGYAADAEGGELRAGDSLVILGFDKNDEVYNVERKSDGMKDSLYPDEFTVAAATATAKKGAAKVETKAAPKAEAKAKPEAKPVVKTEAKAEAKPAKPNKAEKKAAPVVVEKEEEEEEEEETYVPQPKFKATVSVTAAVKEAEGDYLKAAHDLAEKEAWTKFTFGGVLSKIKRENLQVTIMSDENDAEGNPIPLYTADLSGFNSYVRDELNVHDRKAHSLVNIYEKFSQITTEAKLNKVGWTKLRELLPLELDKENVDEWLTKAKDLHTSDLHESVTKTLVDSGTEVHGKRLMAEQVSFKFILFQDQGEMLKEALAEAKKVIGEEQTDSMALNHIITEWLGALQSEG